MEAVVYRRLSELVDRYQIDRHRKAERYVKDLFEALDWGNKPTFSIKKDEGFGYQLLIDRSPVINVLTAAPTEIETVYTALNRAYNQDVEWVVATNFNSLALYGSYWASFRYNVSSALGFQIEYVEYPLEAHRLELLTPQEVSHNSVRELYSAFVGRKRRIPIDIHLVDRMSGWRNLALDALRSDAPQQDSLIHRLINTLFLIRYMEDTGKNGANDRLADLSATLDKASFLSTLYSRFEQVRRRTGYNVPSVQEFKRLEDTPLRQLVNELYGYPELGIEYDFGAMTVDVLGRFYEEYLRLDVLPPASEPATPKLTLFETGSYELQDIRKKRGVYYTPRYIVDYILKNVIERFKSTHPSQKLPRILDIATGSGTFLTAALDWLQVFFPHEAPVNLVENLIGIDIDERAIEAARLSLTAKLLSADQATRPRPPDLKLYRVDLIRNGPNGRRMLGGLSVDGVEIVVGNPPYINYEGLKQRYGTTELNAITSNFETAQGRFDSYILFVEAAQKTLHEGGLAGLVLPNRILNARASAPLRNWLADRADILEVVDFLHQPVFQGVGSYVCLLLFRKRSPDTTSPQVTVSRLHSLSEAPGSQLARISVASGEVSGGLESFRVGQPSGPAPWVFRNKKEAEIAEAIDRVSDDCLGDVLDIRQGVKTGADGVFVIDGVCSGGEFLNVPKTTHKLEANLLVPIFRNRDLKRWGTQPRASLLYPYDRAKQKLIPWGVLEKKFPGVAEYLTAHRKDLRDRKSLRGKEWYELIEPRLFLVRSNRPRLYVAELSLRPTVSHTKVKDTLILGGTGGGSVLELKNPNYDVMSLMAYLNSLLVEWHFRQVSPLFRGGYILLEQKSLARVPVPRFLKDVDSFARNRLMQIGLQIAQKSEDAAGFSSPALRQEIEAVDDEISSLVLEATKITSSQADLIRKTVKLKEISF